MHVMIIMTVFIPGCINYLIKEAVIKNTEKSMNKVSNIYIHDMIYPMFDPTIDEWHSLHSS